MDSPLVITPRLVRVQLKVRVTSGAAFGQLQTNNHTAPLECGDLSPLWYPASERKRRQVAALHSALVICPSFARILTRTFNCTPSCLQIERSPLKITHG